MPEQLDKLQLDNLQAELRVAISAADYVQADRLASEYAEAARQAWESLAEAERASSPLPQAAQELLTWARGMTIVQRAIASEQLAILQKVTRYKPPRGAATRAGAFQVRG